MPKEPSRPRRHRKNDPYSIVPAGTHTQVFTMDELYPTAPVDQPLTSFTDVLSADGRRQYRVDIPMLPPSPVKQLRREQLARVASDPYVPFPYSSPPSTSLEIADESYDMLLVADGEEEGRDQGVDVPLPTVAKEGDPALAVWRKEHRDEYLELLLWHDRRGASTGVVGCPRCNHFDRPAVLHSEQPLHFVERWNGNYFKKTSLKSLGLRVQLGHEIGHRCIAPHAAHSDFCIVHTNGIHTVTVDFCGCHLRTDAFHIQLLKRRWYPSTTSHPRTCATFACLDAFHALSLKAKTTAYDYYGSLEYLTDGSGVKPTGRYREFLRMVRQFRHLLLLKRAGRGHAPGGVAATRPGELALRCPACPRPEVNLPPGWQNAPLDEKCLYVMFLAIDACFRLKRRMISSWKKDPGLGTGWAYFVEWEPYREYLLTVTDQKEMSTCSGLAALDHANNKFSRGYSTTGVGMCVCARHEFVQANGVGDLQKGERYANIDWIFASVLRHISRLLELLVSYDIACQWWKHLLERLKQLPPLVRLNILLKMITFVIPKMHIKGHTLLCQLLYSLYLALNSGQTDGEGIERVWAMSGGLASSTKASGPGARADQLDDHWAFWNWLKLIGLPALLRRRLDTAISECAKQEDAFETFSEEQCDRIPAWKALVEAFEGDDKPDKPKPANPYEPTVKGLTEQEVRKRFEEEEAKEEAAGVLKVHEVSASAFITFALDVEEEQRRIRIQVELKQAKSTAGKINLGTMRKKLNKSIQRLRTLQATYTPGALVHLGQLKMAPETLAESVPLVLPSDLSLAQ
ncbi:hypothetical protein C8F01DRAFT_1260914 [Mycena amicta]|nr:hypothetical protein C8F01DRAFT_1260914 [Mycena amicta]